MIISFAYFLGPSCLLGMQITFTTMQPSDIVTSSPTIVTNGFSLPSVLNNGFGGSCVVGSFGFTPTAAPSTRDHIPMLDLWSMIALRTTECSPIVTPSSKIESRTLAPADDVIRRAHVSITRR